MLHTHKVLPSSEVLEGKGIKQKYTLKPLTQKSSAIQPDIKVPSLKSILNILHSLNYFCFLNSNL
jgi:hypothetical protein